MDILNKYSLTEADLGDVEIRGELPPDFLITRNETIKPKEIRKLIKVYGHLFKTVTIGDHNWNIFYETDIPFKTVRFGCHKYIVFFDSIEAINKVYFKLKDNCYNITNLRIEFAEVFMRGYKLDKLVQSNQGLKSYSSYCSGNMTCFSRHLPNSLEELSLKNAVISKEEFNSFMKDHTALKNISLEYYRNENSSLEDIISILLQYALELESLKLHYKHEIELSVKSVEALSKFNYLKKFHIYGKFTVTKEMVTILRENKSVEDFGFHHGSLSTEVLIEIMKFSNLKSLSLATFDNDTRIQDWENSDEILEPKTTIFKRTCKIINLAISLGLQVEAVEYKESNKVKTLKFVSSTINESNENIKPLLILVIDYCKIYDFISCVKETLPGIQYVLHNVHNTSYEPEEELEKLKKLKKRDEQSFKIWSKK